MIEAKVKPGIHESIPKLPCGGGLMGIKEKRNSPTVAVKSQQSILREREYKSDSMICHQRERRKANDKLRHYVCHERDRSNTLEANTLNCFRI
jgi:hypothetical protein